MSSPEQGSSPQPARLDRRALLAGGAATAAGVVGYSLGRGYFSLPHPVFLAKNQTYGGPLARTIADGLAEVGFDVRQYRRRTVLLKPNMVEPRRDCPHMTTHPAVIVAVAEVFRRAGANVIVGEGPGHVRDTDMALAESGVGEALSDAELLFADLNYQDVTRVPNVGGVSLLRELFLPQAAMEADLIVSLPKLKTHHWMGLTASMKNLYGLLPGIKYGWPKNVLHHAGIPQTVVDICSSVERDGRCATIGIVDAIECMEGDGPILGSPKPLGVIAVGANLTALDATCARLMALEPWRIPYLHVAAGRLGPLADWQILQRGERWQDLATPFEMLDAPHLRNLRAGSGELVT